MSVKKTKAAAKAAAQAENPGDKLPEGSPEEIAAAKAKEAKSEESPKENSIKAVSKPKGVTAYAKKAIERAQPAIVEEAKRDDVRKDDADYSGVAQPLDKLTSPDEGNVNVRITTSTRSVVFAGRNILEDLRRTSLEPDLELSLPKSIAHQLVDKHRAVIIDGDEELGHRGLSVENAGKVEKVRVKKKKGADEEAEDESDEEEEEK